MTGRVEPLGVDEARRVAAESGIPEEMARLSIFQVLLRQPGLAKPLNDLLLGILFRGSLPVRLRELVIMRTGWVTGSVYEWTQHWAIAQTLGVEAESLLAVRDWPESAGSAFDEAERAALGAVDDVAATGEISEATWAQLRRALPAESDQVELVMLVTTYSAVSALLRSLEVPLEEGVDPWPPDGRGPAHPAP